MTKKEIVDTVYNRTTLKKKEASAALDAIISSIIAALASGQKLQIPSKKFPYFKAGKNLKEIVDYEKTGSIDLANIDNPNSNVISIRSL